MEKSESQQKNDDTGLTIQNNNNNTPKPLNNNNNNAYVHNNNISNQNNNNNNININNNKTNLPLETDPIIKLNVGGKKFHTAYSTLVMSHQRSMLARMIGGHISGSMKSRVDEKGYLFIDRNPDVFQVILDYLRTGHLFFGSLERERVLIELDFFGIEPPEEDEEEEDFGTEIAKEWDTRVRNWFDSKKEILSAKLKNQLQFGSRYARFTFADDLNRGLGFPMEWVNASHIAPALLVICFQENFPPAEVDFRVNDDVIIFTLDFTPRKLRNTSSFPSSKSQNQNK